MGDDDDFTPLEMASWGGLLGMHGRLMRRIDSDLQLNHQLSHVEFEALLRLSWAEGGRLRIQDLAAKSVLTRSGVSRVVERLERLKLVRRENAPEDRRGAYAVLTTTGRKRFQAAFRSHIIFVRHQFISLFSEDELTEMADFWVRVEERMATSA